MPEPLIDPQEVESILKDCLYTDAETTGDPSGMLLPEASIPPGAVVVEGILHTYAFHPERLESHRNEVGAMLMSLPLPFRPTSVGGGGGWSFLNACMDANDEQWTGLHLVMEQLFCLGIGLDQATWLLPKEVWSSLPGGMPYVLVKI